ncbi:helix-turn-helix transcriptional regulator [Humibacillus xanthopallidus]|uniref:Putative ArsR family transcriptional regulator n=1 Tax=Humibacillus xanthopallidus TaxID=412689 RepID=A0A543HA61_9MICO|nr:helix-turn-helix domain-containing protein [Humibacillus xanthopallidus]TQM55222.1 putative ArsR family transcriptional regulator [Humibacillus xanthopallidus]
MEQAPEQAPEHAAEQATERERQRGPEALPEVPPARERVLEALAGHGPERPATIGALVEVLGGHPNTTRAHLARLVDDGLVARTPTGAGTRGRPALGHQLTERGRLVVEALRVSRPVSTDELVTAMAEHLAHTSDPEVHARAIGRRWASQLSEPSAGSRPAPPVDTVVGLLTTAGFSPQVEPDGDIALRTCPVLASARAHPGVVCTMHEEMLRATLDRSGAADTEVHLVPFAREGACLVRLSSARRG